MFDARSSRVMLDPGANREILRIFALYRALLFAGLLKLERKRDVGSDQEQ
jgi:hypothetical protein